ncbi:MAG: Na+/H+-dicarboxylate symporters, partial [uncultured Sphingomonadaceae bacterium]
GQAPDHLYPDRARARHRRRLGAQRLPERWFAGGRRAAEDDRRLFRHRLHPVPAPDQDDHRAPRLRHPGAGHRPHGRHGGARPRRRARGGLVRRREPRLAQPRPASRQPVPAGRRPRLPRAGRRRRQRRGPGQVRARRIPHPHRAHLRRRRHGEERDPADRRLLALHRRGDHRGGREGEAARPRDRWPRRRDARRHRLRDALRAAGRVRRRHRHLGRARAVRDRRPRLFHGHLLRRAGDPLAAADRRWLPHRRPAHPRVGALHPRAAAARLLHRLVRSRLSAHAGRARPLRRPAAHRLLRAAARLFVQPRRLHAVHDLCEHFYRPGLRHRPVARHDDRHAARADDHLQGRRRRPPRLARRDLRHPHDVRHPGGRAAPHPRRRPFPRYGPLGDQRGRQRRRRRRGSEVGGGPARAPRARRARAAPRAVAHPPRGPRRARPRSGGGQV